VTNLQGNRKEGFYGQGKETRNSYQIDYLDPHGKRVRLSFSKKKDAVAELGKRVSLIAEKRYLDVRRITRQLWRSY